MSKPKGVIVPNDTVTIKLNNKQHIVAEFEISVNPKDLNKFVDDSLEGLDLILRNVISIRQYNLPYEFTTEDQKVEIDNILDGLKNE